MSKTVYRRFINPPERLQDEALLRDKRALMHAFSRISRHDVATLSFEGTYRVCFNLMLHKYSAEVMHMLRLAANATMRNLRPKQANDAQIMLKDVTRHFAFHLNVFCTSALAP